MTIRGIRSSQLSMMVFKRLPAYIALALCAGCVGLRYDRITTSETPTAYGKVRYYLHEPTEDNLVSLGKGDSAQQHLMESAWRYGEITTLDALLTAWGNPVRIEHHGDSDTYVFHNSGWAVTGLKIYPVIPVPVPIVPIPRRPSDTQVEVVNNTIKRVSNPSLSRDFYGCVFMLPYPYCGKIDLNHVEY
jgi:hypothetical protein